MTNLLAIDTTTDSCSVAFATNEEQVEHTRLAPRLHNRFLLTMIDDVLRASSVDRRALDVVAFSAGPGSFTGVRIGAAAAMGIAFGTGAKVVAVPSASVLAETARQGAGLRGVFAVHRASRKGWRYCARYELRDDGSVCLEGDELEPTDAPTSANVIDGSRFRVGASVVAALALADLDRAVDPALAQPLYLAADSPWKPSEKAGATADDRAKGNA